MTLIIYHISIGDNLNKYNLDIEFNLFTLVSSDLESHGRRNANTHALTYVDWPFWPTSLILSDRGQPVVWWHSSKRTPLCRWFIFFIIMKVTNNNCTHKFIESTYIWQNLHFTIFLVLKHVPRSSTGIKYNKTFRSFLIHDAIPTFPAAYSISLSNLVLHMTFSAYVNHRLPWSGNRCTLLPTSSSCLSSTRSWRLVHIFSEFLQWN